jgi:hypothetical protein
LSDKNGILILRPNDIGPGKINLDELQSFLLSIDGIASSRANYATQTIRIEFDPKKLNIEKVRKIVEELRTERPK